MNPSGFNDAQKLADAVALARSFKSGKVKANRTEDDIYGREREIHNRARERQYIERQRYSKAYPIAERLVLPSKRVYGDDLLEKGWKINGINSRSESIAQDALGFLSRCDQKLTPLSVQVHTMDASTATVHTTVMRQSQTPATAADSNALMTPPNVAQQHIADKTSFEKDQQVETENQNQNIDKLAELLGSFSFTEPNTQTESPGTILEAFLELLAGPDVPQHLEEAKRSCIRPSHIVDDNTKLKTEQHTPTTSPSRVKESHRPENFNSPTTSDTVLSSPRRKRLCPRAASFVPLQLPGLLNTRDAKVSEPNSTVSADECRINNNHAFAGSLKRVSDSAPEGFWPESARIVTIPEISSPSMPVWAFVPQHGLDLPHLCSTYVSTVESVGRAVITTPSEPMRGLSASRWANVPGDELSKDSEFV